MTNHVINTKSPTVPQPAPSPPPAKPAPARPSGVSYNAVSDNQHNNVNRATVHHNPPPVLQPPPPASPPLPPTPAAPLLSAPPPRAEVHHHHQVAEPGALRQPNSLQISDGGGARGRTPTRQKRPARRERSGSRALSRDPSRDRLAGGVRPGSRQRTPVTGLEQSENNKTNGLDSLNLDSVNASKPHTGNGSVGGNFSSDLKLPAEDQIRYRGVHQEIPHFGAPPKRTESLYMKPSNNQQATFKVLGNSAIQ